MSKNQRKSVTVDIRLEGAPGLSVFQHLVYECVSPEEEKSIQDAVNETVDRVGNYKDDRALVLVGALLIENAIDGLLSALMPGYKALEEKKEFTFSLRIEFARALRLIPVHVLTAADTIRGIRNVFAHKLQIDTLAAIDSKQKKAIIDRLRDFGAKPAPDWDDADKFGHLVIVTTMALRMYKPHVTWLNEYIRSSQFPKVFADYCMARRTGKIKLELYKSDIRASTVAAARKSKPGEPAKADIPLFYEILELVETQVQFTLPNEIIEQANRIGELVFIRPDGARMGTILEIIDNLWGKDEKLSTPGAHRGIQLLPPGTELEVSGKKYSVSARLNGVVKSRLFFGYVSPTALENPTTIDLTTVLNTWKELKSENDAPVPVEYKIVGFGAINLVRNTSE